MGGVRLGRESAKWAACSVQVMHAWGGQQRQLYTVAREPSGSDTKQLPQYCREDCCKQS
jgi:hypothetical protein